MLVVRTASSHHTFIHCKTNYILYQYALSCLCLYCRDHLSLLIPSPPVATCTFIKVLERGERARGERDHNHFSTCMAFQKVNSKKATLERASRERLPDKTTPSTDGLNCRPPDSSDFSTSSVEIGPYVVSRIQKKTSSVSVVWRPVRRF